MMCFKFKTSKSREKGKSTTELRSKNKSKSSEVSSTRTSRSAGSAGSSAARRSIPELYAEKKHNFRVFTYTELKEATHNFSKLLKIGEGGFGSVYKGRINNSSGGGGGGGGDSRVVAIKKLNVLGMQGHKEWVSEVQFLGVLDHPNLVKLLGYCAEDGERGIQRLLVYEYMANKSLEDHLFNRSVPAIPWITRLKIILGAAEGMTYLHQGLEVQVIYRDFKASNILLDKDFKPKISDFGLAREGPLGDQSHVSTAPVGTYGYAAPEYVEQGHLSNKSDLYSFGVVLYEILTGRRAIERLRPAPERKLLEWLKQFPADSRKFVMIMDPRLRNQFSLNAAKMIAKLADSCLSKNARDRPEISHVVEVLKSALVESEQADVETSGAAKVNPNPGPVNPKPGPAPNKHGNVSHSS